MGRGATKAASNVWYQARIAAAKWKDRLSSREGAAEALGVSEDTVKNVELGLYKCMPVDLAVIMADEYNAPQLLNHTLAKKFAHTMDLPQYSPSNVFKALDCVEPVIAEVLPCKIGDGAWAIRSFRGYQHPRYGVVSDMYFTRNMKLQIVVKNVARGEWGETVFGSEEGALAAIEQRNKKR